MTILASVPSSRLLPGFFLYLFSALFKRMVGQFGEYAYWLSCRELAEKIDAALAYENGIDLLIRLLEGKQNVSQNVELFL